MIIRFLSQPPFCHPSHPRRSSAFRGVRPPSRLAGCALERGRMRDLELSEPPERASDASVRPTESAGCTEPERSGAERAALHRRALSSRSRNGRIDWSHRSVPRSPRALPGAMLNSPRAFPRRAAPRPRRKRPSLACRYRLNNGLDFPTNFYPLFGNRLKFHIPSTSRLAKEAGRLYRRNVRSFRSSFRSSIDSFSDEIHVSG